MEFTRTADISHRVSLPRARAQERQETFWNGGDIEIMRAMLEAVKYKSRSPRA